jgi:hypothetical protein
MDSREYWLQMVLLMLFLELPKVLLGFLVFCGDTVWLLRFFDTTKLFHQELML